MMVLTRCSSALFAIASPGLPASPNSEPATESSGYPCTLDRVQADSKDYSHARTFIDFEALSVESARLRRLKYRSRFSNDQTHTIRAVPHSAGNPRGLTRRGAPASRGDGTERAATGDRGGRRAL